MYLWQLSAAHLNDEAGQDQAELGAARPACVKPELRYRQGESGDGVNLLKSEMF